MRLRRCRRRRAAASARVAIESSSPNIVASCAAPPAGTLSPSIGVVRRLELAVEVVQPDDRQRLVALALLQQVTPHDALAVLRLGHVEQERRRRREVDAAHVVDHAAANGLAAREEGGAHVGVALQVLHVRDVAVLAEERRARDQRPRRRRIELVRRRGEHDEVAGARGMRHVRRAVRAVGDVARLGLREGPVDHVPALGAAVAGPVV